MKKWIQKYKSKLLTKLFTEWVASEFDLETLTVSRTMIQLRETEIKQMLDYVNKVEVRGYK